MSEPRQWVFDIPAPRHLSLNDRNHWSVDKDVKAEWRMLAKVRAKAARVPKGLDRIEVELHAVPPTNHRRDADNLFPNVKPLVDGLRDAGIVADDTPDYVAGHRIVLHKADGRKRWRWVAVVREVTDELPAAPAVG